MTSILSEIKNFDVASIDRERLKNLVSRFDDAKLLVFGDLILDEHLLGTPERISREAPVIILKYLNSRFALGGAANAAANAAALGAQTTLIGVLGDDSNADEFSNICDNLNVKLVKVIDKNRDTTTKTRIVSTNNRDFQSGTGQQQQILRVDKETVKDCEGEVASQLIQAFNREFENNDISLLSDYSNGVLCEKISREVIQSGIKKSKMLIADSNGDQSKFTSVYSMTPNQPDIEKSLDVKIKTNEDLQRYSREFLRQSKCRELLLTRGAKGMALVNEKEITTIPALNLSEVFDVTGAGDTVSATYCLALAVGAMPLEAALLGNLAASLTVRKYGAATTSKEEIYNLIDAL